MFSWNAILLILAAAFKTAYPFLKQMFEMFRCVMQLTNSHEQTLSQPPFLNCADGTW